MNNTNPSSPARDITAWADSTEVPADLFPNVETYRDFVRNWRKLYGEISLDLRWGKVNRRLAQAKQFVKDTEKHNLTCAQHPGWGVERKATVKAWRQPLVDVLASAYTARFGVGGSELLKEFLDVRHPMPRGTTSGDQYAIACDATWLMQQRQAGKRWVKTHCTWKTKAAA